MRRFGAYCRCHGGCSSIYRNPLVFGYFSCPITDRVNRHRHMPQRILTYLHILVPDIYTYSVIRIKSVHEITFWSHLVTDTPAQVLIPFAKPTIVMICTLCESPSPSSTHDQSLSQLQLRPIEHEIHQSRVLMYSVRLHPLGMKSTNTSTQFVKHWAMQRPLRHTRNPLSMRTVRPWESS